MSTVTVTYHDLEDAAPKVKIHGVTFFDGKPEELNCDDHAALLAKLRTNRFFSIQDDGTPADLPKRRGRPRLGLPDVNDAG